MDDSVVKAEYALCRCRSGTEILPVLFHISEREASVLSLKRRNTRESGIIPLHERTLERVFEDFKRKMDRSDSRIAVPIPSFLDIAVCLCTFRADQLG